MDRMSPLSFRKFKLGATILVLMVGVPSSYEAATFSSMSVDTDSGWDRARIILACKSKPSLSSTSFKYLTNPARVVVTLSGSIDGIKEGRTSVGDSFLKSITVDKISRSRFQITAYLAAPVDKAVIDFYDSSRMNFAYIDIPRPSRYRQPWWTYAEVKQAKDSGIPVVVIDAGHGGYDPGAISRYNKSLMEKDVVLDISREVARVLKRNRKVYPVMTRSGDYYPTLDERVDLVRNTAADLFVSIHADSAPKNRSANGFAVWKLNRGKGSYKSRANQTSKYGWKSALDQYPPTQQAVMMKRQSSFVESETQLAAQIMTSCLDRVPNLVNRGIKPHDYNLVVLRHDYSPAILIEAGFLSNSGDSKKLTSSSFRTEIGAEIARGIESYFENRARGHRRAPIRPRIKVASLTEEPLPYYRGETFDYRVRPNETLSGLAQRFNVTKDEILIASGKPLTKSFLYRGEVLKIPATPSQTSITPPSNRSRKSRREIIRRLPESMQLNGTDLGLNYPGTKPYEWGSDDSLLTVALRHGVTEHELFRLNHWSRPRALTPGDIIRVPAGGPDGGTVSRSNLLNSLEAWAADEPGEELPPPYAEPDKPRIEYTTYKVRPGDTLSEIAATFKVSVTELKRINSLKSHLIDVKQELKIPISKSQSSLALPLQHAIRSGENLEKLAKQYGTSVRQLKQLNGLKGDRIHAGEVLRVR